MKKVISVVLGIAFVGWIGWQVYLRATTGQTGPMQRGNAPVAVEIQAVKQGEIRDVGVFTGSLTPKSQFVVAPRVSGWLKELLVHVGDTVQQNQVIAVLDDQEFKQQVEQARAELEVAKANAENSASGLEVARREYERSQTLREKQIASASELDEAGAAFSARQAQLKVSQAQVNQREAALRAAELRLSYTQVRAFWEGSAVPRVVGERFVDEGALLQVNQAIVSILENDPLVAVVYVIERDYPKVKIHQEATVITDAYPNQRFNGTIVRIAPLLQESSRQARVEIEIANADRLLKPGMFVRANVEFTRRSHAQLVPLAAVVRRNNTEGVFMADTNLRTAHFVPVTQGIVNGQTVEVIDPALSGPVITMGNHLLEDGSSIILPANTSVADRSSVPILPGDS